MLAAPLVAGHVSTGLIGFVDSVIAGHHGTATLAGVAVGTALFWLPMMIPMGTLMSLPPAVSQLDGAGRRHEIGALFRQGLWLAVGLGLALFVFLSLVVHALEPMGIAPEIRPGATAFLNGIRWGVPALTLYLTMRYLSDGLHWTLPTMLLGFGGLLLLVPLGYVFTYGIAGASGPIVPEMGAGGLGLASAIMMWTQALAFALYLARACRFADIGLSRIVQISERARVLAPPFEARTGLPFIYFQHGDPRLEFGWSELYALRRGSWKLIDAPRPELYDLREDDGETRDLASDRSDEVETGRGLIRDWVERLEQDASEGPSGPAGADVVDWLQSLGYVGAVAPPGLEDADRDSLPDPKDRVREFLDTKRATGLLAAGRYDEAIALMEKILVADPGNLWMRLEMGHAWQFAGNTSRADAVFEEVLKRFPETPTITPLKMAIFW